MKNILLATFAGLVFLSSSVLAESFRATTLRAAPGQLEGLLEEVKSYRKTKRGKVIIMRHSQGDHWDLMLLEPAGREYADMTDFSSTADFQHSFLADCNTKFRQLKASADEAGLYHIEMFHALAGKKQALLDQREGENEYLKTTGQTINSIFVTRFGSDVDVFTIGFHADMTAFAKGPSVSDEEAELAARKAGFKNRADLGFYLRSLLTSHYDTLAVPIAP
ncbi:MAG: hypothetical protein ACR2PS_12435 [Pseudomonadales bacterium]